MGLGKSSFRVGYILGIFLLFLIVFVALIHQEDSSRSFRSGVYATPSVPLDPFSGISVSRESVNQKVNISNLDTPSANEVENFSPIVQKVMVIAYDTRVAGEPAYDNQDPIKQANILAIDLELASTEKLFSTDLYPANVDIQIVRKRVYKKPTPKIPGTNNVNYNQIINYHNICGLVNDGTIDEVWIMADGTGGLNESIMIGPADQIYYLNSLPLTRSDCNKPAVIMGLNYTRWYDSFTESNGTSTFDYNAQGAALESFGHRIEDTVTHYLDNKYPENTVPGDNWYEFDGHLRYNQSFDKNYCGNSHYTFNAQNASQEYTFQMFWSKRIVATDCNNWNPQHTGAKESINCDYYGCFAEPYFIWWMSNIPGRCNSYGMNKTNGESMPNWWELIYKNNYKIETEPCSTPSANNRCNSECNSDIFCTASNRNYICKTPLSFGSWADVTSEVSNVGWGTLTSFNSFKHFDNYTQQHLVTGGKIWARDNQGGWSVWQNVTQGVWGVGSGTITDFTSNIRPENYVQQYLVKGGNVWTRNDKNGWNKWENVTSNITSQAESGSGTITSFSVSVHPNGYLMQFLGRGGKMYYRDDERGWSEWKEITSQIATGSGVISSITALVGTENVKYYVTRDGKLYTTSVIDNDKRCRDSTNPFSLTCK